MELVEQHRLALSLEEAQLAAAHQVRQQQSESQQVPQHSAQQAQIRHKTTIIQTTKEHLRAVLLEVLHHTTEEAVSLADQVAEATTEVLPEEVTIAVDTAVQAEAAQAAEDNYSNIYNYEKDSHYNPYGICCNKRLLTDRI